MDYPRHVTKFTDLHDDCLREIFCNFKIKEKFKYERVQKVWQTLIHESTEVLDNGDCIELTSNFVFEPQERRKIMQNSEEMLKRFQDYFRKCPNVTTINISRKWPSDHYLKAVEMCPPEIYIRTL